MASIPARALPSRGMRHGYANSCAIEPVAANGFRARSGEPLPLTAEGRRARKRWTISKKLLEERVKNGRS